MYNTVTNLLSDVWGEEYQGMFAHFSVSLLQENRNCHAYAWKVRATTLMLFPWIAFTNNHFPELQQKGWYCFHCTHKFGPYKILQFFECRFAERSWVYPSTKGCTLHLLTLWTMTSCKPWSTMTALAMVSVLPLASSDGWINRTGVWWLSARGRYNYMKFNPVWYMVKCQVLLVQIYYNICRYSV